VADASWENQLYFGDNLPILRTHIPDSSVGLVYLDPPFNSNASYNVLFKEHSGTSSEAQITAFEDTWHWDEGAERTYRETIAHGPDSVARVLTGLRSFLSTSDMMAYLAMMAPRLVELHRVLKPNGSLYLHCDPTASHYLKVLLDAVFGPVVFRNEVVWKRTSAHSDAHRYGPVHDILLFYGKGETTTWNPLHTPHEGSYVKSHYRRVDTEGRLWQDDNLTGAGVRHGETGLAWRGVDVTAKQRHWMYPPDVLERLDAEGRIHWTASGWPRYKRYLDESPGVPLQDVWTDISPINARAQERMGYPTQKPEALLERIIEASSNPGDVVLDPFCGCGTAVVVAERLRRRWIGIDVTHLAIALMRHRLQVGFGSALAPYRVSGEPTDVESARALFHEDPYQFQWWALGLVQARPAQNPKRGADRGIDGTIYYIDDKSGNTMKIVIQVKGGHVTDSQVRDLLGVMDREKAVIGAFLTLEPPTRPMMRSATEAGLYQSPLYPDRQYARLQILTIEDLLSGRGIQYDHNMVSATFKRPPRRAKGQQRQGQLL